MDIGNILRRAWEIIWTNKILWLFGIFAAFGSGGGGGGGGNFQFDASSGDLGNIPPEMRRFFFDVERFFNRMGESEIFGFVLIMLSIICVLAILSFLIRTFGRVALIKGAAQAEAGQNLSFGQLFRDTRPHYASALGLNLVLGLAVFLAVISGFILVGIFGAITFGIGLIIIIPLLCLIIPLAFGYNIFTEFANNALVLEDLNIWEAMKRGWQVLRENIGDVALMALIVIILGFILGFIVAIPVFAVVAAGFGAMIFGNPGSFDNMGLLIAGGLGAFLVTLVLAGILRSYLSSVWTLTYLDRSNPVKTIAAKAAPKTPKKSPSKKSPAKKSPAKKTPTKKKPAKKTPAKKSPPKKRSS
jgi:hypothetical protein